MRRPGSVFAFSSCIAFLLGGGSCTGQGSPYDEVPWSCFGDRTSCQCFGGALAEGARDPRPSITSCTAELDCCFVIEDGKGGYDCRCIENPPDEPSGEAGAAGSGGEGQAGLSPAARCTREATEHDTTKVVAHCPPVTLDSSAVCSVIFESCDPAYLESNGLVACCDGLTCAEDSNGQLVCIEVDAEG